ncbi:MAG: type II toxin-antitoxin system VapC family toxin [Candidatus Cloacimonadota bacterium]|nr:type II toxin-antitoxin system VapC family toxin [Candidatus Cloacimonadota bacterium]
MKKQRIYVDTSVIGGCFDKEFEKWSNGLFRDFEEQSFLPVISTVTDIEISKAPQYVQDKYLELKSNNAEVLQVDKEIEELASMYIKRKIVSKKFIDDATHIALATVANVDLLVSWNFKHIVHFEKIRLFNSVNLELGYGKINIYSPREVTTYAE